MIDQFLNRAGLTAEYREVLAVGVANGYQAWRAVRSHVPFLQSDLARQNLGNVINIAVQVSLDQAAQRSELFYTERTWNAAHNYLQLVLRTGGLAITSHYCGRSVYRSVPVARFRGDLAAHSAQLPLIFKPGDAADPESFQFDTSNAYVHLEHHGRPSSPTAQLRVIDQDQIPFFPKPLLLDLPEPEAKASEEVGNELDKLFAPKSVAKTHEQ